MREMRRVEASAVNTDDWFVRAHDVTVTFVGAANSPASDGKFVFALYSSCDLVALDLDGNVQWIRGLGVDYPNASNSLGMSSSLVVADGTVVAQIENDSQSIALGVDALTGVTAWPWPHPSARPMRIS